MELKSREYYAKTAENLKLHTDPFINGEFVKGGGKAFDSVNPATGQVIATLSANTAEEVYAAEKIARAAFEDGRWSGKDPAERKKILMKLGDLIEENLEELAVIETIDSGKPIFDNVTGDVPETAETFRFHAEAIDKIQDAITTVIKGRTSFMISASRTCGAPSSSTVLPSVTSFSGICRSRAW